jgi:hypothetical protein
MQLDKNLTDKIELQFLQLLIDALENNLIDAEPAKAVAKEFLTLSPSSYEDLKTKLQNFVQTHHEFQKLSTYLSTLEEKEKTDQVVNKMQSYI